MKLVLNDPLTLEKDHDPIPETIHLIVNNDKVLIQKRTLPETEMIELLWWLHNNTFEFDIYRLDKVIEDCVYIEYSRVRY